MHIPRSKREGEAMQQIILFLMTLLFAHGAFGQELDEGGTDRAKGEFVVVNRLHQIFRSKAIADTLQVLTLEDGLVFYASTKKPNLIKDIQDALNTGHYAALKIKNEVELVEVKILYPNDLEIKFAKNYVEFPDRVNTGDFVPTILSSIADVETLHNSLNIRTSDGIFKTTQCFKRAHVWSTDMKNLRPMNPVMARRDQTTSAKYNNLRAAYANQGGINSMKVFIFYTKKYLQECDSRKMCKWWFHVAPYVHVATKANGTSVQEYVLDPYFLYRPYTVRDWMRYFISPFEKRTGKKLADCPTISSISEYYAKNYTDYCFLRKTPMYYYDPLSIENVDINLANPRRGFNAEEVDMARRHFTDYRSWYLKFK